MRMLALIAILSLPRFVQDKDPVALTIPLKGLKAACCESPIQDATGTIDNVGSSAVRKWGEFYVVDLWVKLGRGVLLSDVEKALAVANKTMGDKMGTKYEVEDWLPLSVVHLIKTTTDPDEAKLKAAFAKLQGFKSVRVAKGGFGVAFEGDKQATLADVKKASGLEVTDVVLAPSKDGARFSCPKHPETASTVDGKCPVCQGAMEKIAAGTAAKPPVTPGGKKDG